MSGRSGKLSSWGPQPSKSSELASDGESTQEHQCLYGIDLGVPLDHRGGLSRSFCLLVSPGDRSWDWCLPCLLFVDLGYFHIDVF